jgi:hypothetical protein
LIFPSWDNSLNHVPCLKTKEEFLSCKITSWEAISI